MKWRTILTPANSNSFFFYGELYMAVISDYSYISRFEEKKWISKSGVIKIYTQWRRVLTTEEFALAHQNDVTFAIRAKARLRQTRCHRLSYLWKDRVAVI